MTICNRYNPEVISCFVDRELHDEKYQEVGTHLDRCKSCRELAKAYGEVDHMFEKNINITLSDLDLSATKSRIMERIDNQRQRGQRRDSESEVKIFPTLSQRNTLFDNICNLLENALVLKIRRGYLQMGLFAAVIFFSALYFDRYDFLSDTPATVSSHLISDPSITMVTSVAGDISSLMILESADKKMTIIWYKEV